MEGYEVVTPEGKKVGRVVGTIGDTLVVEHGHGPLKSKNPLPLRFAHVREDEHRVLLTGVSKELLYEAPKIHNGELDPRAVAAHYGLDVD